MVGMGRLPEAMGETQARRLIRTGKRAMGIVVVVTPSTAAGVTMKRRLRSVHPSVAGTAKMGKAGWEGTGGRRAGLVLSGDQVDQVPLFSPPNKCTALEVSRPTRNPRPCHTCRARLSHRGEVRQDPRNKVSTTVGTKKRTKEGTKGGFTAGAGGLRGRR